MLGGSNQKKKSNTSTSATEEEKILYKILLEHFDGNTTAVLGIMCNVQYESGFKANNLENINNRAWGITDQEYTDAVNDGSLTKEEFIKDAWGSNVRESLKNGKWVNPDGGYGFCQFTTYDKKKSLYEYCKKWFSDGGEGEGEDFDISDPTMQANYICYLLDNDFKSIDTALKAITGTESSIYMAFKV